MCRHGCTQSPQTKVQSNARLPSTMNAQSGKRLVSPREQLEECNQTSQWMLFSFPETVDSGDGRNN